MQALSPRPPSIALGKIGKEKKLVAQFAGSRESLDRGEAVRVTFNERKTPRALAFSHFFVAGLFLFSDRCLLWPLVQKTDCGPAVSFSHLAASASRCVLLVVVNHLHNNTRCHRCSKIRATPFCHWHLFSPFPFVARGMLRDSIHIRISPSFTAAAAPRITMKPNSEYRTIVSDPHT